MEKDVPQPELDRFPVLHKFGLDIEEKMIR